MYHSQALENIAPFNELILTWNGKRPTSGTVNFYVRLKTEQWSPYLLYASWGTNKQCSYANISEIRVYQDTITTQTFATGYEILVEGADVADFRYHVFVNQAKPTVELSNFCSVQLQVPGLSQRILNHPRKLDLCSPTSTVAVTEFLLNQTIDPLTFASNVIDSTFDIYGNWVLNLAHASSLLGDQWNCWVERLNGFALLHARLLKNTPVIVSVKGPLSGSALPYAQGHLLVVTGYDSIAKRVCCMDPAFPTNSETLVQYPLQDFVEAWNRRGFISYIFEKNLLI